MAEQVRGGVTHELEWTGGSCTGRVRYVNEDAFGVREQQGVFVVADGCGGRSSGRRASDIAVACLLEAAEAGERQSRQHPLPEPLAQATLRANEQVLREAQDDPDRTGMGCTLAALRLSAGWATIVHVGDCRVGRLTHPFVQRVGRKAPFELHWLTADHALWTDAQVAGHPEAEVAKLRSEHGSTVVTRAVGACDTLDVDVQYRRVDGGQLFVLCSDGLYRQVDQRVIGAILRRGEQSLEQRCRSLLDAAAQAGGNDNATVILVRVSRG